MKNKIIHLFTFGFIVFFSINAVQNPFSMKYIETLKQEKPVFNEHHSLYKEIMDKADSYNEPAIDARVDKVWKAVPGYNGLEVDVEASYEKMEKTSGFDEDRLVFKEISPTVHLDDLPPTAIYRGNEEKPMVSFLINVAWGNEYLPNMLKTLKKHGLHTTFFLDGSWVKDNPNLTTMLVEEGHEIGNHAYSHPDMNTLTKERIDEELSRTNAAIKAAVEITPKWFAPPSGSYNQSVVDRASELGMKTIMWSVDTVDWRKPDTSSMVERVLSKVHPGAMILMHPTAPSSEGLEQMIIGIKEKGYKIGTVSDLLSEDRVTVTTGNNRGTTSGTEN